MKKLLFLLFCFTLESYAVQPSDCANNPSEYIMQFLKKSRTLWRGSEWRNKLNNLSNNEKIHTVYARTHLREYYGWAAYYFKLNETGIKSEFAITNKENHFIIDSQIEQQEDREIANDAELQYVRAFIMQNPNGHKSTQQDYCTECDCRLQMMLDEKKRMLRLVSKAKCKSKIPVQFLKEQLEK